MNDKDEQQTAQVKHDAVATPEGLGHDPLEWLQEDDEPAVVEAAGESNAEPQPVAASPEVTAEAEPAAETESASETTATEVPEPSPAAETSTSASDNQSFAYDNHKAILTLPEKLTVHIIEPLHSEWKTLLYDLPQSLEVDASGVRDVDAAGMQLFYALVQQMVFKGSDVVILNVQPSLKRHFDLFGLEAFFAQYIHAA